MFQKPIKEDVLKRAILDSKYNVEYHASKNTYHLSKSLTNKGTMTILQQEELDLTPNLDEKIGIGDSGLDIPMFEYCDEGIHDENSK